LKQDALNFAVIQLLGGIAICIALKKWNKLTIARSFFFMYGLFSLPITASLLQYYFFSMSSGEGLYGMRLEDISDQYRL